MDRETGRSRGFGFVTYAEVQDADVALKEMEGYELDGRNIHVSKPNPRGSGGGGGGGFGGGGGYGGGGGFGGRGGGGGAVCRDFQRQRCTRGDSCRFSHEPESGGGGGGAI
jgi:cold-inducible RNA-binding protein